jgi:hypothetical protein
MSLLKRTENRPSTDSIMIPIMPDEEFHGSHWGDPIPPGELVDADEFFENPDAFQ